jgi:hypothetical protein
VLNRNIITDADVRRIQEGHIAPQLLRDPPAWTDAVAPAEEDAVGATPGLTVRMAVAAGATTGPGGVPVPTADDYLTKLVKYIPIEVLGAYLFFGGVVNSNVTAGHELAAWLGYGLVGFGVITVLYSWRVLHVARVLQLGMSVVALAAYVFATGGWFGTTSWYHSWYGAIVLPIFALLVAIVPIPALPQAPPQ